MKDVLRLYQDEDPSVVIVEDGDWEIDYKDYASKSVIIKHGDKHYRITEHRSGSYYTDYDYSDPDIEKVAQKIVSKTIWVAVK